MYGKQKELTFWFHVGDFYILSLKPTFIFPFLKDKCKKILAKGPDVLAYNFQCAFKQRAINYEQKQLVGIPEVRSRAWVGLHFPDASTDARTHRYIVIHTYIPTSIDHVHLHSLHNYSTRGLLLP